LFNGHFIEAKALYALEFDAVSCVGFIGEIDAGKAFAFISESLNAEIVRTLQHSFFDHSESKGCFSTIPFSF
jgi:hypothetical protein